MNDRILSRFSLLILVALFAINTTANCQESTTSSSTLTFDPPHQRPISFSDDKINVHLIVGKNSDSIAITRSATQKTVTIALPEEMAQVDGITRGVSDKLVIWGMVNGSAAEVVIISTRSDSVIDRFSCYIPAVSPNGEYVAFIKFYPMHFSEGVEDHYMLYDVKKDPVQNRPKGISVDNWLIVGNPIYAPGIGNEEYDNIK